MSIGLRDIVRRHVEQETLIEFLKDDFENTPSDKKEELLDTLRRRGEIDREINSILDAFLKEIEENSPAKKKRKARRAINGAVNVVLTTLIGYAVNITNWWFVGGVGVVMILINTFYIFQDE